jgi:hypothetical protein
MRRWQKYSFAVEEKRFYQIANAGCSLEESAPRDKFITSQNYTRCGRDFYAKLPGGIENADGHCFRNATNARKKLWESVPKRSTHYFLPLIKKPR